MEKGSIAWMQEGSEKRVCGSAAERCMQLMCIGDTVHIPSHPTHVSHFLLFCVMFSHKLKASKPAHRCIEKLQFYHIWRKDHLPRDLKRSGRDFEDFLTRLIYIIKEATDAQRRGMRPLSSSALDFFRNATRKEIGQHTLSSEGRTWRQRLGRMEQQ